MDECVFCKIADGDEPASIVYADDKIMAFMAISQINPGHVLVIPKVHAGCMAEMDPETGAHLFRVSMGIAAAVRRSGVKCEGVNLFVADGEVAFQDVFHFHLDIIPRFRGDGFGLVTGPNNHLFPGRNVLDKLANEIAKVYQPNK